MSYLRKHHNQIATLWLTSTPDGYGGHTYATPTTIKCRWEQKAELFISPGGEELRSNAKVYVGTDIAEGSYLYLGTSSSTSPITVNGAYEVRAFRKIPTLRGDDFERVVFL